jgi:hypothetical protein
MRTIATATFILGFLLTASVVMAATFWAWTLTFLLLGVGGFVGMYWSAQRIFHRKNPDEKMRENRLVLSHSRAQFRHSNGHRRTWPATVRQ